MSLDSQPVLTPLEGKCAPGDDTIDIFGTVRLRPQCVQRRRDAQQEVEHEVEVGEADGGATQRVLTEAAHQHLRQSCAAVDER